MKFVFYIGTAFVLLVVFLSVLEYRDTRAKIRLLRVLIDHVGNDLPGSVLREKARCSRGTVYVLLAHMEDDGLIESSKVPIEQVATEAGYIYGSRQYRITQIGIEWLAKLP